MVGTFIFKILVLVVVTYGTDIEKLYQTRWETLVNDIVSKHKDKRRTLNAPSSLNVDDKRAILDFHNDYRSDVALGKTSQPKAAWMHRLFWDDAIGEIGHRYLNGINTCRQTNSNCASRHNNEASNELGIIHMYLYQF